MRATVFRDGALAKRAGQFVWLSIDTEREGNLAFVERYPVESWPTLMVIDSAREVAVLRWPRAARGGGARAARNPRRRSLGAVRSAARRAGEGRRRRRGEADRAALAGIPRRRGGAGTRCRGTRVARSAARRRGDEGGRSGA